MFLMNWERFNEYCQFLFPFLFDLEKRLQPQTYSRLQRNIGYIAEALLGFWIRYKKYSVKYVPFDDLSTSMHRYNFRTKLREIQRDLGFKILYPPSRQNISFYPATLVGLKSQGYDIIDPN